MREAVVIEASTSAKSAAACAVMSATFRSATPLACVLDWLGTGPAEPGDCSCAIVRR
jgi:hypothetical protein